MPLKFLEKFSDMFKDRRIDVAERFELLREAISGTMSSFYMARDRKTGKVVGLKILDPEKCAAFEERFKVLKKPSEGEIAMKIVHPRIAETYEYGTTKDGKQYLVMEFVEGQGLHAILKNQNDYLNGKRLNLFRQMTEALDAVHKAGFIHRDVCPRNFIVSADAMSLKLIDFGLTLPIKREYMLPGNRTGTPLYMAPEIVRRKPTDLRVDIFALGVTAYQMWTFDFPWPSGDPTGKGALHHDSREPTPITQFHPKMSKSISRCIMQCIEADPNKRPDDTEAVLTLIRRAQAEHAREM
jgi:serine/threonine-protein kinase